jgi:hypothetical protein
MMNITWLRSVTVSLTEAAARIQAAETFSLATLASNYTTRVEGGQLRLVIRKPPAFTADLAESPGTFANAGLATAGINTSVQVFVQLWIHFALIPLEARMYHMLGIPFKERRVMVHLSSDYFQELTPLPLTRRYRLWEQPGFGGAQLLLGDIDYTGATNPAADAAVRVGIQTTISRGSNIESYEIRNPAPNVFTIALLQSDGTLLAHSPLNFATRALARQEMLRIWQRIFRVFSMQGFYMIEHLLLEPVSPADEILDEIKIDEPYSFQATFVFPSGYARNFAVDSVHVAAQPENYRDPELRKYTEQQIRKACPAHILPRVVWIDDALPGTPVAIDDPSFVNFENRYRLWLSAYLAEGTPEAVMAPLRNNLVTVLNEIYKVAEA